MLLGKSKRAHEMVQCSEAGSVAKGPKKIPTKVTWGRVVYIFSKRVSSELFRSVPEVFRSEGGTGLFRSGTRWEQFGHSSEQFVRVLRNLSPRGKAGWDCNRWAEGRLLEIHGRSVMKIKRSFGGVKSTISDQMTIST